MSFDDLMNDVRAMIAPEWYERGGVTHMDAEEWRERFDEHDDPFYEDPPNCYGTAGSFDCQFTQCRHRRYCYITYTNREASRRAGL